MNLFSVILIFIVLIVTVISEVLKSKQRQELFSISFDLCKNFNLLFSKFEEKIEKKGQNNKTISQKHKSIEEASSNNCSDLVVDLVEKEMHAHAIVDIEIKHKHNKASLYLASPFEEKRYIIKGKDYIESSLDEIDLKEFEKTL